MSNISEKYFKEEDIQHAQSMAKLMLKREKALSMDQVQPDQTELSPEISTTNDKPKNFKINHVTQEYPVPSYERRHGHVATSLHTSNKRKFREGKMRIKQAARVAKDIANTMENLNDLSRRKVSTTFITPLELQTRKKRWEDFCQMCRRSLFSLKREVSVLSLNISKPLNKLPDNSLRLLSSASRSCLHLLKGFENFSDEIKIGQKGNSLLSQALVTAQQILLILAMAGISFPSKTLPQSKNETGAAETMEEDSSFEISDIPSSEMDSKVLQIFKPDAVRGKLAQLAQAHLAKTKKLKKKRKDIKIIAPLRKTQAVEKSSESCDDAAPIYHQAQPIEEYLGNGRKIQFIYDTLSPKLRRKKTQPIIKYRYSQGSEEHIVEANVDPAPAPVTVPAPNEDAYGISEKRSDAPFEGILPYINENHTKSLEEESTTDDGNMNQEPYDIADAPDFAMEEIFHTFECGIGRLAERLRAVDAAAEREKRHLARIKYQLDNFDKTPKAMELKQAILRADEALMKNIDDVAKHHSSHDGPIDDLITQVRQVCLKGIVDPTEMERIKYELPKGSTLVPDASVRDEVRSEKLEFWKGLVDQQYIIPPKDGNALDGCCPQFENPNPSKEEKDKGREILDGRDWDTGNFITSSPIPQELNPEAMHERTLKNNPEELAASGEQALHVEYEEARESSISSSGYQKNSDSTKGDDNPPDSDAVNANDEFPIQNNSGSGKEDDNYVYSEPETYSDSRNDSDNDEISSKNDSESSVAIEMSDNEEENEEEEKSELELRKSSTKCHSDTCE